MNESASRRRRMAAKSGNNRNSSTRAVMVFVVASDSTAECEKHSGRVSEPTQEESQVQAVGVGYTLVGSRTF